jgi:hypothetical protein
LNKKTCDYCVHVHVCSTATVDGWGGVGGWVVVGAEDKKKKKKKNWCQKSYHRLLYHRAGRRGREVRVGGGLKDFQVEKSQIEAKLPTGSDRPSED